MTLAIGTDFINLFPSEFKELLNAIRRDMRSEAEKALVGDEYASVHGYNSHKSKRLLELLNPKRSMLEMAESERKEAA